MKAAGRLRLRGEQDMTMSKEEESVHRTALRTIQLYLLGEMDFATGQSAAPPGNVPQVSVDGIDSGSTDITSDT